MNQANPIGYYGCFMLGNKKYIPDNLKQDIANEYISGVKTRDLSKKYSLSSATIVNILNKFNIKFRNSDIGNDISERSLNIISLHKQGFSRVQIRNRLNIPKGNLDAICDYFKLTGNRSFYRRGRHLNDNYFESIDNQEKAYFFGLLCADGYVNSSNRNSIFISLKEEDSYLVEGFKKAIESDVNLHTREFKNNPTWKKQISISVSSKKMKDDLIKHGCTPQKSLTLKFPSIQANLLWHFIRGYFDGDGCVSIYKVKYKHLRYYKSVSLVGSRFFIKELKNILEDKYSILCRVRNYDSYSELTLLVGGITKFRELMYMDAKIFMKRKKSNFI